MTFLSYIGDTSSFIFSVLGIYGTSLLALLTLVGVGFEAIIFFMCAFYRTKYSCATSISPFVGKTLISFAAIALAAIGSSVCEAIYPAIMAYQVLADFLTWFSAPFFMAVTVLLGIDGLSRLVVVLMALDMIPGFGQRRRQH